MNLANKITIFRIITVPIFIICFYFFDPSESIIPGLIFIIASFSDAIDGYIARKYNQITDLGKFLDPLADKILVSSAFILMVETNSIAGWIVITIIARELIITGLRTLGALKNISIAASNLGKLKTISQMITIIYFLFESRLGNIIKIDLSQILPIIALLFTLLSGVDYIWKNRDIFS